MNKEIKHIRSNKLDVDYLEVKDLSLKRLSIKALKDIKYNEKESLEVVINRLEEENGNLIKLNKELNERIDKLYDSLEAIKKGLNYR